MNLSVVERTNGARPTRTREVGGCRFRREATSSAGGHDEDGYVDAVAGSGDIVGEELNDRTDSGLWPSDHAAVVVTLHIAKP